MRYLVLLILLTFTQELFAQTNAERLHAIKELKRISFGSCNDQTDDQPLWHDLIQQQPDLWIWGGDNVYVDWMAGHSIKKAYEVQNAHPDYANFKKMTPIIGTWDDHDYSHNNADGTFSEKKSSQQLALDFLEEPMESIRRQQDGIYTSYLFGKKNREIKIILLDNRYFKNLEPDYPMLGKVQWEWLENELKDSSAKINIIMTGLPVLSPLIPYTEEWAEGKDLSHMLEVLSKYKPKGVIFLTGDKHFSSIYRRYGHLEFMSSGMTHVASKKTWPYLRTKFPRTYFGLNYGQMDIKWEQDNPLIKLSIRGRQGRDIHATEFKWQNEKWVTAYDSL